MHSVIFRVLAHTLLLKSFLIRSTAAGAQLLGLCSKTSGIKPSEPLKKWAYNFNGNKEASARELPRTFRETSAKTTGRFSDAVLPRRSSANVCV